MIFFNSRQFSPLGGFAQHNLVAFHLDLVLCWIERKLVNILNRIQGYFKNMTTKKYLIVGKKKKKFQQKKQTNSLLCKSAYLKFCLEAKNNFKTQSKIFISSRSQQEIFPWEVLIITQNKLWKALLINQHDVKFIKYISLLFTLKNLSLLKKWLFISWIMQGGKLEIQQIKLIKLMI